MRDVITLLNKIQFKNRSLLFMMNLSLILIFTSIFTSILNVFNQMFDRHSNSEKTLSNDICFYGSSVIFSCLSISLSHNFFEHEFNKSKIQTDFSNFIEQIKFKKNGKLNFFNDFAFNYFNNDQKAILKDFRNRYKDSTFQSNNYFIDFKGKNN